MHGPSQPPKPFAIGRRASPDASRNRAKRHARRTGSPTFTREEILSKIRKWAELYGEPPSMRDWEPSRARRAGQAWRAERFEAGTWPSARMVVAQFGAFTVAIREAGLQPGRRPSRLKPKLSGPEQILVAIREWTSRYGEPPTLAHWDGVRARRLDQEWRIARYRSGDWPSLATVMYHHGSLGAAVRAAGLSARPHGLHARYAAEFRAHSRRMLVLQRLEREPDNGTLADALRAVARHRAGADHEALHKALLDLATAALRWADNLAVTDE